MGKKINLSIGGMTCTNCESRIEKGLKSSNGVISVMASYTKGKVEVEYDEKLTSKEKIVKKIEQLGYEVKSTVTSSAFNLKDAVISLLTIAIFYYVLESFGILNRLAPENVADSGMSFAMLFVTGLVTSLHCVAMCGGIGLSLSLPKGENENDGKILEKQTFLPALSYNLGRVLSYSFIGFVFGFAGMILGKGAEVVFSSAVSGVLKILAGILMVVMGINMLGIFPWLRKFTIRPPKAFARMIGNEKTKAGGPFAVGVLNGLMPCGPLQSMWLVALATGNPLTGALSMFLFALGTLPLMLGLGSAVSILGKKYTRQVMRAGAVLVATLGLSMLSQEGSLTGLPTLTGRAGGTSGTGDYRIEGIEMVDGVQVLSSTLTDGSYPDITVMAGIPVRWTIDAKEGSLSGCNFRMVIPEYDVAHEFNYGENVIEFTPEKTGVVGYSCWMGMVRGKINVVEAK